MAAIGRGVKDAGGNMPTREQVRNQMSKTVGFVGVIGTYDFDQAGDTSLKIVSVYVTAKGGDAATNSGVCGSKTAKDVCFQWKVQFDFAKP
jgi:ABC-type branched-subunit amino acid transport system substrate-binding protein